MWCYLVPVLVANPWRSKVVCPNIVRYLHKPRRGRRPVDGWMKVVHWLRSRPHPPDCCARDRAGFAPRLLAHQMAPSIVQSVKPHGSVTKFWFPKRETNRLPNSRRHSVHWSALTSFGSAPTRSPGLSCDFSHSATVGTLSVFIFKNPRVNIFVNWLPYTCHDTNLLEFFSNLISFKFNLISIKMKMI